jgi:hypothetical protein
MSSKEGWKWWLIAVLFFILIHLLAGTVNAQTIKFVPADSILGYNGITRCDSSGRAEILIQEGMDSLKTERTLRHERVHVEQFEKRGWDCTASVLLYQLNWRYRFEIELEAYLRTNPPPTNIEDYHDAYTDGIALWLWEKYTLMYMSYRDTKDRTKERWRELRARHVVTNP